MRKNLLISLVMLIVSIPTFAGGLLTNTNQSAAFVRMLARGASIDIDGVYSNPAGLAFLPSDGFYLSVTEQSAFQTRVINASFETYPNKQITGEYEGKASAPIIPSFQAAYKKGNWTFSGSFAITGGGGKASFDSGLPMFDSKVMAGIYMETAAKGNPLSPDMYTINSAMDGKQYIFGVQLGASYKINDYLSVFGGGRMNYVSSGYEGFLTATGTPAIGGIELANISLNCEQSGWGVTPIIGADVKFGKFNVGLKYEFKTNLNIENKVGEVKASSPAFDAALADYKEGVNTPNDIPALLTAAVGYEFLPTLRATAEYHYFFDKQADMAYYPGTKTGKQTYLTSGTTELLFGAEWDVTKVLTVSAGYQNTNYGLADDFQSDTSFSCDSYTIGFGGAIKLNSKLKLNVGYFWTTYSDYTKATAANRQNPDGSFGYNGTGKAGTDVYSRTNKVFGIGIDYKF